MSDSQKELVAKNHVDTLVRRRNSDKVIYGQLGVHSSLVINPVILLGDRDIRSATKSDMIRFGSSFSLSSLHQNYPLFKGNLNI